MKSRKIKFQYRHSYLISVFAVELYLFYFLQLIAQYSICFRFLFIILQIFYQRVQVLEYRSEGIDLKESIWLRVQAAFLFSRAWSSFFVSYEKSAPLIIASIALETNEKAPFISISDLNFRYYKLLVSGLFFIYYSFAIFNIKFLIIWIWVFTSLTSFFVSLISLFTSLISFFVVLILSSTTDNLC